MFEFLGLFYLVDFILNVTGAFNIIASHFLITDLKNPRITNT